MKLALIVLVLFLVGNCALGQKKDVRVVFKGDSAVRDKLIAFNYNSYVGKTVKEFLRNDTIRLYRKYFWIDEPPMKLYYLCLEYAKGLYVNIYVASLKYQPRMSIKRKWSFDKYLKEQISNIELDKDFFEENVLRKHEK